MTELEATVLIPTHDHGPLVRFPIESALAQTVQQLEVFVVGDGAPEITREIVTEISSRDARVRFFDNPKGPRHGEIHRHAALAEARGRTVLYLSDDDLWLPEHVETMLPLLENADLACAVCMTVSPDGSIGYRVNDLGEALRRRRLLENGGGIGLSQAGHTLASYRSLPFGWRTTPPKAGVDEYIWQQFVADPDCRATASDRLTVISLPSAQRGDMTPAERLDELSRWWERVRDPEGRANLHSALLARVLDELAKSKHKRAALRNKQVKQVSLAQRFEEKERRAAESRARKLAERAARLEAKAEAAAAKAARSSKWST
jgi:GalNAc5-diNAcBac-PP-undecaprenol beta-1,3-glucosyltransferase